MGNQSSSDGGPTPRPLPFGRSTGALGLSKSELDKRCKPSGLYDSCPWEDKAVRKLIGDGRIVARLKGSEERTIDAAQECPICFLYYSDINVTKCCSANVCTECYLQVRPQKEKYSSCPFCNNPKLTISVAKKLSEGQIKEREKEEQKVVEARIKAQNYDTTKSDEDTPDNSISSSSSDSKKAATTAGSGDGFGSSLQKDQRVALIRARSESMASSERSEEAETIQSFAMSADERRRLEEEMRSQSSHPLALRVEAEAAERRLQNDRAYYRSNSDSARRARAADLFRHGMMSSSSSSRRRGRGQSNRDWNQIVEEYERGGNGQVQTIDDLVVLEAAILLSMEEESRRARDGGEDFDPARHAREGFPLVRSFLANRESSSSAVATSSASGTTPEQLQSLARNLSSNRRRNQLLRATQGRAARSTSHMPDTAIETASMLMRGISEEEQIAMAIAASLQEQQSTGNNTDTAVTTNEENNGRTEQTATSGATESSNVGVAVVVEEQEGEGEDTGDDENVTAGVGVAVGVSVEDEAAAGGENSEPVEPTTGGQSTAAEGGPSTPEETILAGDSSAVRESLVEGIAIETGATNCAASATPAAAAGPQTRGDGSSDRESLVEGIAIEAGAVEEVHL